MARPIPARLARLGILRVTDNLLPHQAIGGITKDFIRIFRPELEARFGGAPCTQSTTQPKSAK